MVETIQEQTGSAHDVRRATGDLREFEPEILAFCCEH